MNTLRPAQPKEILGNVITRECIAERTIGRLKVRTLVLEEKLAASLRLRSSASRPGIFGGPAGSHILRLLRRLKRPVVTTLQTVLREPDANQRIAMDEIAGLSDRLIVMSEHSSRFLQEVFRVPKEKIDLIAWRSRPALWRSQLL